MTNRNSRKRRSLHAPRRQWWVAPAAFVATLLTLPVNAGIVIPDDPLITAARVAPNILFILDDSGSMEEWRMPDNPPNTTTTNISDYTYTRNTIYYNPNITYQGWMQADGTRMTPPPPNDAYADLSMASGDENLYNDQQTFYVPKTLASDQSDGTAYYRYDLLDKTSARKCEYKTGPGDNWTGYGRCVSITSFDWRATNGPVRTLEQEWQNYANWYSFHRTRMKVAKAGASEAFAPLGSNVRVGFDTLWDRSSYNIPVARNNGLFEDVAGAPNRSDWYEELFDADGSGRTPLQSALNRAGTYFERTDSNGPWGPGSGADQLTCRQNFSILTTDGYWNEGTLGSNQDNTNGPSHANADGETYQYVPQNPYKDGFTGTLADVAMRYWKTDLRTDMTNNVPFSDDDPAFWQHMVTFGISIGLRGTLNPETDLAALADGTKQWPDPVNSGEGPERIDDLWHAAVNGRGAFVSASKPSEFTAGLSAALAAIAQRTSSYSNVATNSASLRTGAMVFNASYVSGTWTGDVKAYAVTKAGGVSATPAWSATIPALAVRKVFTAGGTFPTEAQRTSLARTGGPVNYPVTGTENANYIKGDQSKEGSNLGDLRRRTSLLGDIVGSSPEYVQDTDTLYVGANDGMLHAFNAANGQELFAYVPGILDMSRLRDLSRGDYVHKFLVDGPVVASPRTLTPNRNILVGTLGRGGKGLYALDVTDPGNVGSSPFLWEKTNASSGYEHLGLVLGKPILARVATGAVAVVLGNGVNSTNDRAVLIVTDLETGNRIAEIDTGEGDADTPNGLSKPTGVLGPDGKTLAFVYAGDMLGNVWKFDLTDSNSSNWKAIKLFTAKANGGTGAVQPITSGIAVATDPRTFNRWVFFGTGRFLTTADAEDKSANAQGMYGFIDEDTKVEYGDLEPRGLTGTGTTRVFDKKVGSALPAGKKGWYVNLPGAGERIVQDAQVESNVLVTASMIPTGGGCDAGGSGYINAVDAFTGTSTGSSYFDLDGDGTTTDETVNGIPVGSVDYGVGMPTLPVLFPGRIVVGGTGGGGGGPGEGEKFRNSWNRVTWREIRQE